MPGVRGNIHTNPQALVFLCMPHDSVLQELYIPKWRKMTFVNESPESLSNFVCQAVLPTPFLSALLQEHPNWTPWNEFSATQTSFIHFLEKTQYCPSLRQNITKQVSSVQLNSSASPSTQETIAKLPPTTFLSNRSWGWWPKERETKLVSIKKNILRSIRTMWIIWLSKLFLARISGNELYFLFVCLFLTVLFHLHVILEKTRLKGQWLSHWFPGIKSGRKDWLQGACRVLLGVIDLFCIFILVTVAWPWF